MLQSSREFREVPAVLPSEIVGSVDLDQMLAIVRRQWRLVAGFAVAAIVVGLVYLMTATPRFTSTAAILIDENNQKIVDQLSAISGVLEDEGQVLSQVELLQSEKISLAVSKSLDLEHNAMFMNGKTGILGSAIGAIRSAVDIRS